MSVSLLFDGDIELNSDLAEDDGYQFQVLASSKRGTPIPVEVTLASFLRDGSIVQIDGSQNREMTLQVRVTAPDLLVLALGEKRLKLATEKRTTLAWTPADGFGPATVFEVLTSNLIEPQDDGWDLAEVRNERTYGLRLVCLPFGRSVDSSTDTTDTPPSSGGTVVESLDTATGWSSARGAAAPSVDTVVKAEGTGSVKTSCPPSPWFVETFTFPGGAQYTSGSGIDTFTLSEAVTAGDWLSVKIRLEWPEGAEAGPSEITSVTQTDSTGSSSVELHLGAMDANGFVTYSWRQAATTTVTSLVFNWQQLRAGWGSYDPPHVWYDALTLSPAGSSDVQVSKTFEVGGSARAPGSLHVAAPTDMDALGQVWLATIPVAEVATGFQPDVFRWVASGTSVADVSALHGSHYVGGSNYGAAGSLVCEVPVSTLRPGPYHVYAMVRTGSDPIEVGVEAQVMPDGATAVGPTSVAEVSLPNLSDVWRFVAVGTVQLPPVEMVNADSAAVVRLRTKGSGTKFGEIFLAPAASQGRPGADVTIVDCGTGTVSAAGASSHLWVEAASTSRVNGGVFRGPTSDGLNRRAVALSDELKKPGNHYFTPGQMNAYVAATGVAGVSVTPVWFDHWFGNAAS